LGAPAMLFAPLGFLSLVIIIEIRLQGNLIRNLEKVLPFLLEISLDKGWFRVGNGRR
jgi:hypothetical protein